MEDSTRIDRRTLIAIGAMTAVSPLPGPAVSFPTPAPPSSLPTAHAHNDYRQPRPLIGALDLGFTSIEIDVFPVDDRILVGHDLEELRPDRDLGSMYLDPILSRCREADPGRGPLPDGHRLTLLIDIKRHGTRTLELLLPMLVPLKPWLRRVENGVLVDGPVEVILSGSRPTRAVRALTDRPVFIDGRISDLERGIPTQLMPLVSASMQPTLGTFGLTGLDEEARTRLATVTDRTHEEGRRLRFWGHVESRSVWKALVDARVDHIGTDLPRSLAPWLRRNDPRCGA